MVVKTFYRYATDCKSGRETPWTATGITNGYLDPTLKESDGSSQSANARPNYKNATGVSQRSPKGPLFRLDLYLGPLLGALLGHVLERRD